MFRLNLWTRPFMHPGPAAPPGLDTSSYLPSPLTSQALMVLASTAEGGRGEVPGTQGLSSSQDKDSHPHPGLGGSFPMFRPGDHLAPSIYSPLHQPFLRSPLDPASLALMSPRGPGAFHPGHHPAAAAAAAAASGHDDRELYPSAFMPAKKLKLMDTSHDSGRDEGELERSHRSFSDRDLSSPLRSTPRLHSPDAVSPGLSRSPDSPVDLRSSDTVDRTSPDSATNRGSWCHGSNSSSSSPHMAEQGLRCPVCKAALQATEVQAHLAKEVDELRTLFERRMQAGEKSDRKEQPSLSFDIVSLAASRDGTSKSRYDTFLRIRNNREARLAKIRGRRKRFHDEIHSPGSSTVTMNGHLEMQEKECQEDETIDVIGYDDHDKDNSWSPDQNGNASKRLHSATDSSSDNNEQHQNGEEKEGRSLKSAAGSLKERIKCSVCMEAYTSPVTSVHCWHVHCERCWLQALGTKNCCPQCNIVTSPTDLRRIYI